MSAENARVLTLDAYVAESALERIDFIKLDVDGNELRVLEGAAHTLERFRPTMLMELAPYVLDEEDGTLEGVLALLKEAGYRLTDLKSTRELAPSASEVRHAVPDGAGVNVLATCA